MKNFSYPSYRLASASLEIRIVYSLFLFFAAGGLLTTWLLQFQRIGISYERIVTYYLGGELNGQMFFPKNFNVLLEQSHFHAFIMGVFFLVLSHLFIATSLSRNTKVVFVFAAFFGSVFDMAGIWLVRYLSPLFAYGMMLAWIFFWAGYLAMIAVPLFEMWWRPLRT